MKEPLQHTGVRLVAGCMTGTSLDGLDAALVEVRGHGLAMTATVRRCLTHPFGNLADPLRRLAEQEPMTARAIAEAAHRFALLHVEALRELAGSDRIDLIAVHGQTVYHAPPVSWQLMQPAPIARALKTPVVFDMRAADLAAGGQGAPITPLADGILFREPKEERVVVNFGGFCNISRIPRAEGNPEAGGMTQMSRIQGQDICACNQVLDAVARWLLHVPYDRDGEHAGAGRVDEEAWADLVQRLDAQARAGRSLGTGDELEAWIEVHRHRCGANDLARSACAAIAEVLTRHTAGADRLILAGGSVHNRTLVAEIAARTQARVERTDDHGMPASYREAVEMAILGALCQDRVPITLPQVTGVSGPAPVAGVWINP